MWDRKELKAKGKAAFRANYWKCVIVALILSLLVGGAAAGGSGSMKDATDDSGEPTFEETFEALTPDEQEVAVKIFAAVIGALAVFGLIASVVKILVFNPLKLGADIFFYRNSEAPAEVGEMLYGFKNGYGRVVLTLFLRDLFTELWMLLFIVPGVIKALSYSLTPYILADNPDLSATEAITLSRKMMNGHKMDVFMLWLSFIGWMILNALTCGLVGVFWVNPWMCATDAEVYKTIKAQYVPAE